MAGLAGCSSGLPAGESGKDPSAENKAGVPEYGRWIPDQAPPLPVEYVDHDVDEGIVDQLPLETRTRLKYRDEQETPGDGTPTVTSYREPYEDVWPTFQVRTRVGTKRVTWPIPTISRDEFHGFVRQQDLDGELLVVFAEFDVDDFIDEFADDVVEKTGTSGEATLYETTSRFEYLNKGVDLRYRFAIAPSYLAVLGAGYGPDPGSFADVDLEDVLEARASTDAGLSAVSKPTNELLASLGSGDYVTFIKHKSALETQDLKQGYFEGVVTEGRRVRFERDTAVSRLSFGFENEGSATASVPAIEKSVTRHRTEGGSEDSGLEDIGYATGSFGSATAHSVGRTGAVVSVDATYPIREVEDAMDLFPFR